jgi:two-component system, OmpR family, sensor histidine kinase VicK
LSNAPDNTGTARTEVLYGAENAVKLLSRVVSGANTMIDVCEDNVISSNPASHRVIKERVLETKMNFRYLTEVSIHIAKIYLESGIQVRHVRNLPPMSFGVSDKEIAVTIEKMEGGTSIQSLLLSSEPAYVSHFTSIFEEIWRNGIDASDSIRNIEEGVHVAEIEVIENPQESIKLATKISNSAREELSVLFSSPNSFHRQVRAGLEKSLKEYVERRIIVRLLIPFHKEIEDTIGQLKRTFPQVYFKSIDASIQT